MSCNSAIYTVNTSQTVLESGELVPLGATVRRFGKQLGRDGQAVVMSERGYYSVTGFVTAQATCANIVGIQLLVDGAPVLGGLSKADSMHDKTSFLVTIPISYLHRVVSVDSSQSLSLEILGDCEVFEVSLLVTKI